MSVITIVREQLPYHPLLGRNVHLDSQSWNYALQPEATPILPVRHQSSIGVLDQGQVGSCTGNSACSCAYHAPFFRDGMVFWPAYPPNEPGALTWYAENTREDDYAGTYTYPPGEGDDTGSDTLTSCKVAKGAGIASGYQMSGDLDSSLETLQDRPGLTGIPWFNSMFTAGSDGLLTVDTRSGLAGGHALCVDEVVTADVLGNGTGKVLVGGPNSWGESWGAKGRWYLTADDWWTLRQQQGDVYFWVPRSQPAPQPTPVPADTDSRDVDLWAIAENWTTEPHVSARTNRVATAMKSWARLKGLS